MPELPETETIARDLDGALRKSVVASAKVLRADVLRDISATVFARKLKGAALTGAFRRAKSIVLSFDNDLSLITTPRFTGALLIDGEPNENYTCARIHLQDGRTLRYHDVRRLGTLRLVNQAGYADWNSAMGPEPLDPDLTPELFADILRSSKRAVKIVLMDQKRLAGVGNIYANEALWSAGVLPARAASSLTDLEYANILAALRTILRKSIKLRGTTFRDFRDAYGKRGGYARHLKVYGRAGEPCARCNTILISSQKVDGRQTAWCPNPDCQK